MIKVLLSTLMFLAIGIAAQAQRTYFTSQGEYIFSWSKYTGDVMNGGKTRTRFSLFPNTEVMFNADSKGILGTYFGLALKNIGFNYSDPQKHKRRVLSLGVPLVIKLGDLENDNFFFFGGEIEAFFHYKKKDWAANGTKSKYTAWFSDELNIIQPSAMMGFCRNHILIKFKYYFYDFLNQNYFNELGAQPYLGKNSNVFYVSMAFRQEMGGKNKDFDFEEEDKSDQGFDFGFKPLINDFYRN